MTRFITGLDHRNVDWEHCLDGVSRIAGLSVLVVEDDFLLALDIEILLREHGCSVLGPVANVDRALVLIEHDHPDAALLDVNLGGQRVTPVAAALLDLKVPFMLATAYEPADIEEPELRHAPILRKPFGGEQLARALLDMLRPSA